MSVGVGLGVLTELLEGEVVEVVGPKGKHDPDRSAVRHGREAGDVTLGGRRVAVERPRVRSVDGRSKVRLATYEYFADRDPLSRSVVERMLAGVSTSRNRRTQSRSARRSRGRRGRRRTRSHGLHRADAGSIAGADAPPPGRRQAGGDDDRRLELQGSCSWSTAPRRCGRRSARPSARPRPALRAAQGAQRHGYLPERERPAVKLRLRRAWAADGHARALDQLGARLPSGLERGYPGAAGSLREGMEETLTLTRLGVGGNSAHARVDQPVRVDARDRPPHQRNVKRWSSGEMALRWTAAGMLEAEKQFRKIIGYRDLAILVAAIERDADRRGGRTHTTTKEAAIVAAIQRLHGDRRRKSTARGTSSCPAMNPSSAGPL